MVLIHTALQSEAQYLIEFFKLQKILSFPKIYENDNIILLISGIGEDNTIKALDVVFSKYNITKAINIGIAGCSNKDMEIGELFCTNKQLDDMNHMTLKTVEKAQVESIEDNMLYDMEGKYFEDECQKYLDNRDIYIFKIISDFLSDEIPSKEFVKQLIKKNIKSLEKWI